jgi:hypothetical protein
MKHQTSPHVVETEVTNPLKARGQALKKVATQAHVLDGQQKGDLVVMKPLATNKELHMEIANEDDGSDSNSMDTSEVDDVDVEENQGASSEDGEHPLPNKKRKVADQDDEAGKHHEGFHKPQEKRKKFNS